VEFIIALRTTGSCPATVKFSARFSLSIVVYAEHLRRSTCRLCTDYHFTHNLRRRCI